MQTLKDKSFCFQSNKIRIFIIFLLTTSFFTLLTLSSMSDSMMSHAQKFLLSADLDQEQGEIQITKSPIINSSIPWLISPKRKRICWEKDNSTVEGESDYFANKVVVAFVHSARGNVHAREGIRRTWGSIRNYKNFSFDLIFVLGKEKDKTDEERLLNSIIKNEAKKHGDILLGDFVDAYKNLTYKHLSGYKWVIEQCPMAKYVLKADDDIFYNVKNGFEIISLVDGLNYNNPNNYSLFGCYWSGSVTNLDRNTKHLRGVSIEDFPITKIPPYCYGAIYGLTLEAAKNIYSVRDSLPSLFIDDAFVTGFLRGEYEKKTKTIMRYYGASNKSIFIDGQVEQSSYDNFCRENSSQIFQLNGKKDKSSIFSLDSVLAITVPRENILTHLECLWSRLSSQLQLR